MPNDPNDPNEIPWRLVLGGGLLAAIALSLLFAALSHAGGPVALTWDQSADCPVVTGWELLVAPITTANPNPQPTSASLGASIANNGTPPCSTSMQKTVTVTAGVGATRFWLRAVAGSTKSKESNGVDSSLPLAGPSGLTVAPQ